MTTIQTNDATGEVVIYRNAAHPPAPCKGYTVRQVESIPDGPGTLHWQPDDPANVKGPGQLVRVVPTVSPIEVARGMAKAAFASLPPGKQALWEPVRAAVDAALVAGDVARAVSIIQTVPEIYDGMETDRAAFLALFAPPAQSSH